MHALCAGLFEVKEGMGRVKKQKCGNDLKKKV